LVDAIRTTHGGIYDLAGLTCKPTAELSTGTRRVMKLMKQDANGFVDFEDRVGARPVFDPESGRSSTGFE
jgi:hypothetical protein